MAARSACPSGPVLIAGSGVEITVSHIPPHASRAMSAHVGGRYGVPTLAELPTHERHQWTRGRKD